MSLTVDSLTVGSVYASCLDRVCSRVVGECVSLSIVLFCAGIHNDIIINLKCKQFS